ncbi:MAG: DoxX family protein [Chloroflexi bacterium]|nr:DoxX family protein [Chloroflexota bacterium]
MSSQKLLAQLTNLDKVATQWMARHSITLLRVSVGIVFFWFGVLKFFPSLSPAEELAARTIETLTFGLLKENISLPILAFWECAIGVGLLTGKFMRVTLLLLFAQMSGTILPLFFFPSETFTKFPYAATLEGQYIIKNMVLVSAGLVMWATVRGGQLVAEPNQKRQSMTVKAILQSQTMPQVKI